MQLIKPRTLALEAALWSLSKRQWKPTELHPRALQLGWRPDYRKQGGSLLLFPWYRVLHKDNYTLMLPRMDSHGIPVKIAEVHHKASYIEEASLVKQIHKLTGHDR